MSSLALRWVGFFEVGRPIEKFVAAHEIQDVYRVDFRLKSGGKAEFDESKLSRTVSIGANGNSASGFASEFQEIQT